MPPIRTDPPPNASATALTIAAAGVAPIRVLRARKPLRYPGYPVDLVTLRERAIGSLLLLVFVVVWWAVTPAVAVAGG